MFVAILSLIFIMLYVLSQMISKLVQILYIVINEFTVVKLVKLKKTEVQNFTDISLIIGYTLCLSHLNLAAIK
jgi:uncharacterized membrane protein